MQCVPWPLPSCTGSPAMNERPTTLRPAKSGWPRSNPVSRTATRMPAPVACAFSARVAWRPHVADAVSLNTGSGWGIGSGSLGNGGRGNGGRGKGNGNGNGNGGRGKGNGGGNGGKGENCGVGPDISATSSAGYSPR